MPADLCQCPRAVIHPVALTRALLSQGGRLPNSGQHRGSHSGVVRPGASGPETAAGLSGTPGALCGALSRRRPEPCVQGRGVGDGAAEQKGWAMRNSVRADPGPTPLPPGHAPTWIRRIIRSQQIPSLGRGQCRGVQGVLRRSRGRSPHKRRCRTIECCRIGPQRWTWREASSAPRRGGARAAC